MFFSGSTYDQDSFLEAPSNVLRDFRCNDAGIYVQGALEKELRHYSSLTAGCTIPLQIGGSLFLFKVEQILDGADLKGLELQI